MIEGLHQRYYKNAIINVLKARSGEAYGRGAAEQLRKDGYTDKVKPNKRGIWTRVQKLYILTGY